MLQENEAFFSFERNRESVVVVVVVAGYADCYGLSERGEGDWQAGKSLTPSLDHWMRESEKRRQIRQVEDRAQQLSPILFFLPFSPRWVEERRGRRPGENVREI